MEKSDSSKTTIVDATIIDSTKCQNQMEKINPKSTKPVDSAKDSEYNLGLQILLLVLAIAMGIALAFGVFYIQEDTTMLHDPKFQIEMVSPSSFFVLTRYFQPLMWHNPDKWNLTFSIRNPNSNYDFYYDDLEASISYNDTILWSANVSGKFNQNAKAQISIDSTFAALPEPYSYWIATSVADDLASGQTTRFSVSLNGKVQISDHNAPSRINCRNLQVSCKGLQVEFLEDIGVGVLAVDSEACEVIFQDSRC